MSVCVCMRGSKDGSERVSVCVSKRECVHVREERVCVYERERERERGHARANKDSSEECVRACVCALCGVLRLCMRHCIGVGSDALY